MTPNTNVIAAVEQLKYHVTIGDVAAHTGLSVQAAESDLLVLAAESGAHLQVSESGDIAYQFPENIRGILQRKYWQLKFRAFRDRAWKFVFYLIRISVGVLLIVSIVLLFIAIAIASVALIYAQINSKSSSERRNTSSRGGGFGSAQLSHYAFFFVQDLVRVFQFNYYRRPRSMFGDTGRRPSVLPSSRSKASSAGNRSSMNWLEAIFSFYFGDGNPNAELEDERWRLIGSVIRNHQGAIAAEQVAPYLDDIGGVSEQEDEAYILPILTRFNGRPTVTNEGDLLYRFPELQTTVEQYAAQSVPATLSEQRWRFSLASPGQMALAAGLGAVNIIGIIWLGLLPDLDSSLGLPTAAYNLYESISNIYGLLFVYAVTLAIIPIVRLLWIKSRNPGIDHRNQQRQERAETIAQPSPELRRKLNYAQQLAQTTVVTSQNLAYTTEQSVLEQDAARSEQIDAEWQRRLNS